MNRKTTPSIKVIAQAQAELIKRLPYVNQEEAHYSCWACGYCETDFLPERAHIIAKSRGGPNDPDNFFLLCSKCHKEQPETALPEVQIMWLCHHAYYRDMADDQLIEVLAIMKTMSEQAGLNFADAFEQYAKDSRGEIDDVLRAYSELPAAAIRAADGKYSLLNHFQTWLNGRGDV